MINFWVYLTNRCNLKCKYCYQKNIKKDMTIMTAKKIVNWINNNIKDKDARIQINFYGGEPLLNSEVFFEIASCIKEIYSKSSLFLVTNGLLLGKADIMDFIINNHVDVQLSLDGCKEDHDKNRKTVSGEGSYEIIGGKYSISDLVKKGVVDSFNLTFTPDTLGNLYNNFITLYDYKPAGIQIHPILEQDVDWSNLNEEILHQFKLIYSFVKQNNQDTFVSPFDHMFDKDGNVNELKCRVKCGACESNFTFDTDGNLFPCSRIPDDEDIHDRDEWIISTCGQMDYNIGSVQKFKKWNPKNDSDFACFSCEYKFSCFFMCFGLSLGNKPRYHANANSCIFTHTIHAAVKGYWKNG